MYIKSLGEFFKICGAENYERIRLERDALLKEINVVYSGIDNEAQLY